MIGQIYANLFPGRVRAMMLDGIVDAVDYTTSAETRTDNNVSSADEVFAQFVALCQSAGPGRCALAGHGETVAQRVAGLFATGAPGTDPGAPREPARHSSATGTCCSPRSPRCGCRSPGPSSRRISTPPSTVTRRPWRPTARLIAVTARA